MEFMVWYLSSSPVFAINLHIINGFFPFFSNSMGSRDRRLQRLCYRYEAATTREDVVRVLDVSNKKLKR